MKPRSAPADTGRMHVYPLNDLREHVVDGGQPCWCHPIIDENGIVIHNSLDQRELYERGDLKPM